MLTDVEGSPRRWESDADVMRAALAAAGCVPYKSGKLWSRRVPTRLTTAPVVIAVT